MSLTAEESTGFGAVLKQWRRHRGWSQLALALEAGVSARHLSFLETGRSSPSLEMVQRLLETLEVPLWDRNRWLLAAGFAPSYRRSALSAAGLSRVQSAVRLHLERHEPFPAYAMDAAWNIVAANAPFRASIEGLPGPNGGEEEVGNVLHLLCHPGLLRPTIVNWSEVAQAVLRRVRRQLDSPVPPPELGRVVEAVKAYPGVEPLLAANLRPLREEAIVPIEIRAGEATMRWLTTLITFGGAIDLAVDELVIECFFPADDETEKAATQASSLT